FALRWSPMLDTGRIEAVNLRSQIHDAPIVFSHSSLRTGLNSLRRRSIRKKLGGKGKRLIAIDAAISPHRNILNLFKLHPSLITSGSLIERPVVTFSTITGLWTQKEDGSRNSGPNPESVQL